VIRSKNRPKPQFSALRGSSTASQLLTSFRRNHLNRLPERIYKTGRRIRALLGANDAVPGDVNKTEGRIRALLAANDAVPDNVNKSGGSTDLGAIVPALGDSGG
jgi:hypothetical protein